MSAPDDSIAIVGAGVIGLAIACRLLHDGHRVVLIDRDEPGHGCSWGNAGHLATEQVTPLASPATLRSAPRLLFSRNSPLSVRPGYALSILPWLARFVLASRPDAFRRGRAALSELQGGALAAFRRLLKLAGIETLLRTEGNLLLAESAAGRKALLAEQTLLADCGVRSAWLDAAEVVTLAGGLPTSIEGALHFPDTAHVTDPYAVSRGLLQYILQRGGELRHDDVSSIRANASGGFELRGGRGSLRCGRLVLAAGAWSGRLALQLGHRVPLDTERGYHLYARDWHADFSLPIASYERKTIMTPLAGGLRITGFVEFGGLELDASRTRYEHLQRHLQALLPSAEFPQLERWMGLRPSLPDHLPMIGASHRHRNAIFAFGHQHLGLTLAGITAEIVADLVTGRTPTINIEGCRTDRFGH